MRLRSLAVRRVADGQCDDVGEAGLVGDEDVVRTVGYPSAVAAEAVPGVGRLTVLVGVAADSIPEGEAVLPVRLDAVVPVGGQAADQELVRAVLGVAPVLRGHHDLLDAAGTGVVERDVVLHLAVRRGHVQVVRLAGTDRVAGHLLAVVVAAQELHHGGEQQQGGRHEDSGGGVVAPDAGLDLPGLSRAELGRFVHVRDFQSSRWSWLAELSEPLFEDKLFYHKTPIKSIYCYTG